MRLNLFIIAFLFSFSIAFQASAEIVDLSTISQDSDIAERTNIIPSGEARFYNRENGYVLNSNREVVGYIENFNLSGNNAGLSYTKVNENSKQTTYYDVSGSRLGEVTYDSENKVTRNTISQEVLNRASTDAFLASSKVNSVDSSSDLSVGGANIDRSLLPNEASFVDNRNGNLFDSQGNNIGTISGFNTGEESSGWKVTTSNNDGVTTERFFNGSGSEIGSATYNNGELTSSNNLDAVNRAAAQAQVNSGRLSAIDGENLSLRGQEVNNALLPDNAKFTDGSGGLYAADGTKVGQITANSQDGLQTGWTVTNQDPQTSQTEVTYFDNNGNALGKQVFAADGSLNSDQTTITGEALNNVYRQELLSSDRLESIGSQNENLSVLGANLNSSNLPDGAAFYNPNTGQIYDKDGNFMSVAQPIVNNGEVTGWSVSENTDSGRVEKYFDANGNAMGEINYDGDGSVLSDNVDRSALNVAALESSNSVQEISANSQFDALGAEFSAGILSEDIKYYDSATGEFYDENGNILGKLSTGTLGDEQVLVVNKVDENGDVIEETYNTEGQLLQSRITDQNLNPLSATSRETRQRSSSSSSSNNSRGLSNFLLGGAGIGGGSVSAALGSRDSISTSNAFGNNMKSVYEVCGLAKTGALSLRPDQDIKFVSVAVPCFENLISAVAVESIEGFTGFLSDVVAICLTLYLIFFGIKVSTGITNEQRIKGEAVIHAIKIGFVAWLVFWMGITDMFEMTMGVLQGFIKMVMAPVSAGPCKITSPDTMQVWLAMDCLFGQFIGWNAPNKYTEDGWKNIPLLFGFVTHTITAGFGGAMIGGIILMTIWSLLMSFFRVAFGYILAIMAIVLLFTIAPIMLPMMLFAPTKQFFDQWWKMIVSMVLQPVILFAFMAFSLALMNEIIIGDNGIGGVSGLTDHFKDFAPGTETAATKTQGDQVAFFQVFSMYSGEGSAESIADRVARDKDLIFSLISMLIVAYLLLAFTKFVSSMGHELSGTVLTPNVGDMGPKWMGGKG